MINNIIIFTTIIDEWNDKLNQIASRYMDNPIFGGIAVFALFLFGCWGVSNLNKK